MVRWVLLSSHAISIKCWQVSTGIIYSFSFASSQVCVFCWFLLAKPEFQWNNLFFWQCLQQMSVLDVQGLKSVFQDLQLAAWGILNRKPQAAFCYKVYLLWERRPVFRKVFLPLRPWKQTVWGRLLYFTVFDVLQNQFLCHITRKTGDCKTLRTSW